jgi:hypothetical protein
MFKKIVQVSIAALVLSLFTSVASADTDPFPGVANGSEIPGTRISSSPGVSQAQWESTSTYLAFSCPAGSGRGMGVDMNFTTTNSDDTWYAYCVKTWQSTAAVDAENKYRADLADAQAIALAQSQEWNAAHPGQQKCFQWGPITSPSGGTSSGGVCANPVGSLPSSVDSSTSIATRPTETNTVAPRLDSQTSTSNNDPLPNIANGAMIPGTKISSDPGQSQSSWEASAAYKNMPACPVGSGRAIEVNLNFTSDRSDDVYSTYCVKNWTDSYSNNSVRSLIADSITATTKSDSKTATSSIQIDTATSQIDATTVVLTKSGVPDPLKEESQLNVALVGLKAKIEIQTDFANSKLQLTATKKGSKTLTINVLTDKEGDASINTSKNLKGFTVTLTKGNVVLDKDVVR